MRLIFFLVWFFFSKSCNLFLSGLNIVNNHIGRASFAELNLLVYKFAYKFIKKLIFLCGIDLEFCQFSKFNFAIYQGFFFSTNYEVNIVLPVPTYTEVSLSYLNLEGRYRKSSLAVVPLTH